MRAWLTKNKVFFETITTALLSFMAITVSYWQYQAGKSQAEIARMAAVPQIFVEHKKAESKPGFYGNDSLYFRNDGGTASNVSVSAATFIDLSASTAAAPGVPGKFVHKLIPLKDYFSFIAMTGASKDLLAVISGDKNSEKLFDLRKSIFEPRQGYVSINIDLKTYAEIDYRTVFGDHYIKYYLVDPIFGGSEIPTSDGKKIFSEWASGTGKNIGLNLANIDTTAILDQINKP